jgi:hypothetical protein
LNRLVTVAIGLLCRLIRPDAREALLGDLTEVGANRFAVFGGLLGFVARSKLQPWLSGRPWMLLAGITVPLALQLNVAAARLSSVHSVYVWMYADNWTPRYLSGGWLWSELIPMLLGSITTWLLLTAEAWAGGCVLARLARGTVLIQVTVLIAFMICGQTVLFAILPLPVAAPASHAVLDLNEPVSASVFCAAVLPRILQAVFLVLPLLLGVRKGLQERRAETFVTTEERL